MIRKKRKCNITLIEIMIVILLIGLIGGVLAYNLKGSLKEGQKFKSEQGAKRVKNILMLEAIKRGKSLPTIANEWETVIRESNLIENAEELIRGYKVDFDQAKDDLSVTSQ